ncbi:MAG: phenylalanine--tRNA ligase subunit alpha, partial [Candidatus ainarchaeum sp.]|nr:phenylalanine--tRNA ligase subunit alpha [Candidatus ainarchaeum sp.]
WSREVASKLMPSAHGTAHTAKQFVKGVSSPQKYFAIARCFRPDVLDATHLLEFNQLEGFIIGDDLNFKHLLGMLKDFAVSIAGAEKVKFFPDYYPFTEPSVQLSAKHPQMGWVEFAGAGMFRPEMLRNLGIKQNVIAWGMGIDRLAMFKLGVNDIRYLFSDDLNYLRNAKGVLI